MATYSKKKLSGTNNYNVPKNIYDPGGGAVLLHTTGTSSTIQDEVWLYLTNPTGTAATADVKINTTSIWEGTIGVNSQVLVIPGIVFSGDGSLGCEISAEDTSGSGTTFAFGYVNRITP